MKLVLASKNQKKLKEMNEILSSWELKSALKRTLGWTSRWRRPEPP